MPTSFIKDLKEKFIEYPEIKYEENANYFRILKNDENGFDVIIHFDEFEYTLVLGRFHWHYEFSEKERMFTNIGLSLAGISRIEEHITNGKPHKWIFQVRDKEGNWQNHGTTGRLNLNFLKLFIKEETKYYQNSMIPEDVFH